MAHRLAFQPEDRRSAEDALRGAVLGGQALKRMAVEVQREQTEEVA